MAELLVAAVERLPPTLYAHVLSVAARRHRARPRRRRPSPSHTRSSASSVPRRSTATTRRRSTRSAPAISTRWSGSTRSAYPGTWFQARMLETGRYVGIRRGGELACVAGVHVWSPAWRCRGARQRRDGARGPRHRPRHGRLRAALPDPPRRRDRHDLAQRPCRQRRSDPRLREARLRPCRRLHRSRAFLPGDARHPEHVSAAAPTRICVIGAGAAGLASAASLRRAGAEVTVLEREAVGAAWQARYDCLHLHTVRWLSGLPGYGIPRSSGKWPSRDRVVDYLRSYASRNDLDVRTGSPVERIERKEGGWAVHAGGETHLAGRVVVATGYSNVPHVPEWPGIIRRRAHPLLGVPPRRSVPRPSGAGRRRGQLRRRDRARHRACRRERRPACREDATRRRPAGHPRRSEPAPRDRKRGTSRPPLPTGSRRRSVGSRSGISPTLGLPAPEKPYSEFLRRRVIPIVDVGLVAAVKEGRVTVVPALDRFENGKPVLADGRVVEVDAVIAATGFRTGLEPLVGHLRVLDAVGSAARARRRRASVRSGTALRRLRRLARRHAPAHRQAGGASGAGRRVILSDVRSGGRAGGP